jgi:predicted RNase H-like HicB family nuclease
MMEWYVAYCPEVPGANGQGRTKDEAVGSLSSAIKMILDQRRDEGLQGMPAGTM